VYDRWQGERFVRGVVIVGDGQDNGQAFPAAAEARKFGQRGVRINTFTVGSDNSDKNAQDIAVTGVECDPSPAPIKTQVTVIGNVNAYGYEGARVTARVLFDGVVQATEDFTLDKQRDNKIRMTVGVGSERGEKKVTLQVGQLRDGQIVPLPGELSGENNQSETYLTVTKDGMRILIVDRLRPEEMRVRDVLRSEKRFDLNEVLVQTDGQVSAAGEALLDLDSQAYDVIIIGDVSPEQLAFMRGDKPVPVLEKIREHVKNKGTGLMLLGGERAFRGYPKEFEEIVPVEGTADPKAAIVEDVDADGTPKARYQTVPNDDGLDTVFRLDKDREASIRMWASVNAEEPRARITGYSKVTAKDGARVLAWATPAAAVVRAGTREPPGANPLAVTWKEGPGKRGRVVAFAAYDTYLWEKLGQPASPTGSEIHTMFWKQCALWLAHQEDEEGEAYVHPAQRQLKVGAEQTLRVGVKLPPGAKLPDGSTPKTSDDPGADLIVKVVPMPTSDAKDPKVRQKEIEAALAAALAKAPRETVVRDEKGRKVVYRPGAKGVYYVELTSPKKDDKGQPAKDEKGQPVILRADAKFIAVPDVSDEMLKVNADHAFLSSLSTPTGGKALRLEDLPDFLKELKDQKDFGPKPRPKYYPDWRRNHSGGFLPLWLVAFALLLGAEWGLRRLWGMV